jgi:hypothetical protein
MSPAVVAAQIGPVEEQPFTMGPFRARAAGGAMALVLIATPAAGAQDTAGTEGRPLRMEGLPFRAAAGPSATLKGSPSTSPEPAETATMARVRPLDAMARKAIERGMDASPTIARMIVELQQSDLIVGVQACPLPKLVRGDARVVAAGPGVRYVRIRLGIPVADSDLIVVLGHELRHALEFAAMPEVRDAASLVHAYARVGVPVKRNGYWETAAALEAGRVVARELKEYRRGQSGRGEYP